MTIVTVAARLHGGPRDGETWELNPGARAELRLIHWVGDHLELTGTAVYRLSRRWMGQPEAHYEFVGLDL